jgi:N-acetylglucosaminyldiphosphoundecaprenol N-acetyl-beta-D-mannosaminyltransferase
MRTDLQIRQSVPTERRSGPRVYDRVMVGGLRTDCVSRRQLAQLMVGDCLAARGGRRAPKAVLSTNGNIIATAAMDSQFRQQFLTADVIHADGAPVVAASRLFTATPVPERSATTDFLFDAAAAAAEAGLKFYLLGSTEEINRRAAEAVKKAYPGVEIVGRRDGYFSGDADAAICEEINASGADVLWVGMGVPRETQFSLNNRSRLKVGWIVTCGGCFNFAAGDYVRAPGWMQKAGLEWLHRLLREPRRLFWRYLITNPVAIAMLLFRTGARAMQAA